MHVYTIISVLAIPIDQRIMTSKHARRDDVMNKYASSSLESQSLLSVVSSTSSRKTYTNVRQLCIMSKPITLILLWTLVIGAVHFLMMGIAINGLLGNFSMDKDVSLSFVIIYLCVAFISVFYPVNGFLADVFCGRRNVLFGSLGLILSFFLIFVLVVAPISFKHTFSTIFNIVVSCFGLLLAIIGIAGYGANFIQFGLDQLLEAPSQQQAIFVHWAKWSYDCFSVLVLGVFAIEYCEVNNDWIIKWAITISITAVCACVLLVLIAISCWKRRYFYTECAHKNPYKLVATVLSFVWKHKYPLQRSAFTYCDNEMPSRLDFAKERYGGPFTTEQVEDVKVLFRIVLILLAVGPVFSFDFLIDNLSFAVIGLHVGTFESIHQCSWNTLVTNAGFLRFAVSTFIFPVYMCILFSLFRNRVPKILPRIGYGMFLYFVGMLSVFATDTVGHRIKNETDETDCILHVNQVDNFPVVPSLGLHWSLMIPSIILLSIAPTVLTASVFEFISAQSPHTMKGFLFGVFFAIRGMFQFFGSISLFVLTSKKIWASSLIKEHPPTISCLSRAILFLCAVVLISIILFCVLAKRYKNRERGDRPYDQRFVVDFYSRVIENRERDN